MGVEQRNTVTFKCDDKGCSTTLIWIDQEVRQNPDSLPDAAWRIVNLGTFDGQLKAFCSKACLLSYLRDFIALKSPKELAEIAAQEKVAALTPGVIGLPPAVVELNPTTQTGTATP